MMQRQTTTAILVFVTIMLVLAGISAKLNFHGQRLLLFLLIPGLVAAAACFGTLWYLRRRSKQGAVPDSPELKDLELLVRAADTRLKSSLAGSRGVASMPLIYVIGDENSAKTQSVLQAELDPELLAGTVFRDGTVEPTALINVWYTRSTTIVEAGGKIFRSEELWRRLVKLTQPARLRAALRRNDRLPTRAVVVCVSLEHLLGAEPGSEALRSRAQAVNDRLRQLSEIIGISLPVYVLFTKLDTVSGFPQFAANMTDAEVQQPFGSLLPQFDGGAGLYGERATAEISARFEELCYNLGEFRLELLSRGSAAADLARAYELPRELRKLRQPIVDLLVGAGRPSQLGVNPFLRGFYFTGVRARLTEEAGSSSQAGAAFLNVDLPGAVFSRGSNARRRPQWVFLPHLFSQVLLTDRSALETSQSSTKVKVLKRSLAGVVALAFLVYLTGLIVSFARNSSLESRLTKAAALPTSPVHSDAPDLTSLRDLEQLRLVFEEISALRADGAPLSYRWGLFEGDRLFNTACKAYGERFRTALLAPTQANLVSHFQSLPAAPGPGDDYSASYVPLRAYLITTAYPSRSTTDFLPPALQAAWTGGHTVTPEEAQLASLQFKEYAGNINGPSTCMAPLGGAAQMPPVTQARAYLNHFQGLQQVYLSMKTADDRRFPAVRFNEQFPGSARYVVDPYTVEGAFTKGGWEFMQNAFAHPEPYTSGEPWVLGAVGTGPIDLARVRTELPLQYQNDFITAWRSYLKSAHVVPSGSFPDAREKLHQVDSPSSSLLELFQLISTNTAVPNPAFSQPFEAPQTVVPPARPLPANSGYMQGLQGLEGSINSMLLVPNSQNNPAAISPVIAAASQAESAVEMLRSGFTPPDPAGGMDVTSEHLLLAPIRSVEDLAKQAPARAAGGGAQALCAAISPVLNKFPFNPEGHTDATMQDVAAVFEPGKGALARYAGRLQDTVVLQGNSWAQAPGSMVKVNPAFLHFLNAAQGITELFFPANGQPQLNFTLSQEATPNLPPATLTINSTVLNAPAQAKSFTWNFAPTSSIHLTGAGNSMTPPTGPWSLFHLAYTLAKHPAPNRLEFVFEVNGHTVTNPTGVPLDYKYDVGGAGASLLNPAFMRGSLRCTTRVAAQ